MANYPSSAPSFTTRNQGDTIDASHINSPCDEITAIGSALLTGLAHAVTTNGQVVFPAAQNASTGANTLDDYEEATWTPGLTSSGGGAATYVSQIGTYIKVGQQVFASGRVTMATKGTLAAGTVTITLPFVSTTLGVIGQVPTIGAVANLTTPVSSVGGAVSDAAASMTLNYIPGAGGTSSAPLLVADISTTFDVIFTVCYRVSA